MKRYLPQHTSTDKINTPDGRPEVEQWKIDNKVSWRDQARKRENR